MYTISPSIGSSSQSIQLSFLPFFFVRPSIRPYVGPSVYSHVLLLICQSLHHLNLSLSSIRSLSKGVNMTSWLYNDSCITNTMIRVAPPITRLGTGTSRMWLANRLPLTHRDALKRPAKVIGQPAGSSAHRLQSPAQTTDRSLSLADHLTVSQRRRGAKLKQFALVPAPPRGTNKRGQSRDVAHAHEQQRRRKGVVKNGALNHARH